MSRRWMVLLLAATALLAACGGSAGSMAAPPAAQPGRASYADESAAMGAEAAPMEPEAVIESEQRGSGPVDFLAGALGGTLLASRAPAANKAKPAVPQPAAGSQPPPPPGPQVVSSHAGAAAKPTARMATPLLIYTATFRLAVFEVDKTIAAVDSLARELGGYLVRRDRQSITVRVPTGRYQGAIKAIAKLGDVLDRQENVEDVTDKFFDLKTRLANARAIRDRLQKLLEQAKDVKEALAVERELGRVTGDIERMAGRLKRLRELIAFSTITVELQPRATDRVKSDFHLPFQWLRELGLSNLLNL